jgi:ribosomal protein S18 acetylase RimI-like enzyme
MTAHVDFAVPGIIRPYRPADREAVHRLAADTAFFGAPVETFLPDRRAFSDAFVAYYTDHEPQHAWVAEADGAVAGYLTGSIGGRAATWGKVRVILAAARQFVTGRYRLGRRGAFFAGQLALAALRGESAHADLRPYPAHLHINVAEAYRGWGLGRQLLVACLGQMAESGVPGIHLHTTTQNERAVSLYEQMGFRLLAVQRTRVWEPWLPGVVVEKRVYGRQIA